MPRRSPRARLWSPRRSPRHSPVRHKSDRSPRRSRSRPQQRSGSHHGKRGGATPNAPPTKEVDLRPMPVLLGEIREAPSSAKRRSQLRDLAETMRVYMRRALKDDSQVIQFITIRLLLLLRSSCESVSIRTLTHVFKTNCLENALIIIKSNLF